LLIHGNRALGLKLSAEFVEESFRLIGVHEPWFDKGIKHIGAMGKIIEKIFAEIGQLAARCDMIK
jgi:hypothetical protein